MNIEVIKNALHACYDFYQYSFLHYLNRSISPFSADTETTKNCRNRYLTTLLVNLLKNVFIYIIQGLSLLGT